MNEREQSMPGLMAWELSPFLGLTGQREALVPPEPGSHCQNLVCREGGGGGGVSTPTPLLPLSHQCLPLV